MFHPQALLDRLAPCMDAPAWRLGLSGGLDSMALLHALSLLRGSSELPPISAVHVHHGLHADADRWAAQCADACRRAGVPLQVIQVTVAPGASVENAARNARYDAFEAALEPGEVLLLAHHRDDQIETVLFRLLRGTGLRGLAGMPQRRSLGSATMFRPLLDWPRAQLQSWAQQQGLSWIEDPANSDPRFARTALRHDILPRVRQAWPMAEGSLLRLAEHVGESLELLDERAEEDWKRVVPSPKDPWLHCWPALMVEPLLGLSRARQANLLRFWLHRLGCRMPDQRQLRELIDQLAARPDSQPAITLDGYRLIRASGCLWLLPQHLPIPQAQRIEPAKQIDLPGNGRLCFEPGPGGLSGDGQWDIRYRQGGETIKPAGRPSQSLKHLLQDAAIPAWLRERVPLLYCDGRLVSVGGRWQAELGCVGPGETGWHVRWEPQAAQ
ncbi:tRNA(Ile)-lysidine synthase [Halopseudomonas xinjiangensis]|uniref:tRNA(Ile)-lysidine synthase n=1 Tax=Halopseudomonas xinjiangensis TaxID=487184 RepID=A0A1H1UZ68_9GAMM|nr:tRNA lysidine(34) synthetase TilS [Halopseudomonas xinjiangensis]SDS77680.1 tRNA(Ile)-lysidine synthase [Halopseudomonas xinjiangensis]